MEKSSQKASFGQGLDLATIINKAVATVVKKNNTSSEEIQAIIEKPGQIYQLVEDLLKKKELVKEEAILNLISAGEKLMIEKTSEKKTIADSKSTFKSFIDSNFKNWELNNKGEGKPETEVLLYEMARDATFSRMFNFLNSDLDKLVLTQEQIVRFCEKYPTKLRQNGYGTFFLIKENNEYFVVYVYVFSDGLRVSVYRFVFDGVWDASFRHRVVVPQLIES
jgi:hypothetical protein